MILRISTAALLTATALAAKQPVAKPAVIAQPAAPSKPEEAAPKPAPLIGSEVNMRDLLFLAHALDLGKSLTYLAEQTARTNNPALKGYGDNHVKTLAAQSAVLTTVAEMRNIKAPAESPTQKKLSEKLGKLEGAKLQKALLDSFIEVDERMIATYELGAKSPDATISKFVEQTLPEARKHLLDVQGMAGIAPQYVERTTPAAPAPIENAAPAKPVVTATPTKAAEPALTAPAVKPLPTAVTAPATKPTAPAVAATPANPPPSSAPIVKAPPAKPAVPAPTKPALVIAPANPVVTAPPAPQPAKPETKPTVIAEPPEDVAPKTLEAAPAKPAKPVFRTNIPLQN
jgi:hypothetical protein